MTADKKGVLPSFSVDCFANYLHFEYTMIRAAQDSGINTMIEFEDRVGTADDVPWARCMRQSGEFKSNNVNRTRQMFCSFNC